MKYSLLAILLLALFISSNSFANKFGSTSGSTRKSTSKKKIVSELGLNIPKVGVAIDAVYENRLDNLVPGYKLLNVVITNKGGEIIFLDSDKDKWFLIDNQGNKHKAINDLRQANPDKWSRLPVALKDKLEYPQAIRPTKSSTIDLFIPSEVSMEKFREINWKSNHYNKEFILMAINERNLEIKKEDPIYQDSPSVRQANEKYKTGEFMEETNQRTSSPTTPPQFDPALDDFSISMD